MRSPIIGVMGWVLNSIINDRPLQPALLRFLPQSDEEVALLEESIAKLKTLRTAKEAVSALRLFSQLL